MFRIARNSTAWRFAANLYREARCKRPLFVHLRISCIAEKYGEQHSRDSTIWIAAVVHHSAKWETACANFKQQVIANGEIIVLKATQHRLELSK